MVDPPRLPSPLWGGLGRGSYGTAVPPLTTPTTNSSPQGGREHDPAARIWLQQGTLNYARRCLLPPNRPDRGEPGLAGTENRPPRVPPGPPVRAVNQACPSAHANAAHRTPH